MTLQQLRYVIGIAKVGSFNKAAENLFISQPSLTAAIRDLEEEIGIVIFNRTSRGVSLTPDGEEFVAQANQLYHHYETLRGRYDKAVQQKKKFAVSTQHYSFAVKSFVEMVKKFNIDEYEFALRETKTKDVIDDVAGLKSEIGILYLSNFNRKYINYLFKERDLEFHHLIDCKAYAYMWKNHPLATRKSVNLMDLSQYPCLSFEQGDYNSFYFAEEVHSTYEYRQTVQVNDRASMLNLMVGLNGYTMCSGFICEELNGGDYAAIPLEETEVMTIGYIKRKNVPLSDLATRYLSELMKYQKMVLKSSGTQKGTP
jgi:DNA-binding transcriptional LysR family regulator